MRGPMPPKGKFITIEGGEGSGKSTQIAMLKAAFEKTNIPHVITREPGGEEGAEAIRALLVTGDKDRWDVLAETLLFYAARVQHVARLIQPALDSGKLVLCDRFVDSTRVYQGIGKNISPAFIDALHALTLGNMMPELTIILDIDPQQGLARAKGRAGIETRFEGMELEFHALVRAGFLAIAREEPARCRVLDAAQPPEAVHAQIMLAIAA
jgi:dTMP kinase